MNAPSPRSGLLVVSLLLSVVSLGVAAFALFRSADSDPGYTDAQRRDATTAMCSAFDTVRRGIATNTNVTPPGGSDDITGALAVAANARVALFDGGQYLLARLDPATPADLAGDVRRFAGLLLDIGAAATAGVPNTDPVQAGRLKDAESASTAVSSRCR
ncbi:hypothetical protein Mycch_2524 [Mycolicibacterium chubuense NBB4]|uniref:Alanine and proline rich membrane protein n=1 Tax=Mycolicibacterium chubuense (strain NBB4) TaxID=710421 RepID=I4BJ40_MYCCN|nr:hypothetical protein [Mycolicibacterium chubuense]AFM17297.1 hypothetical protein Mycch_2524 [Mycolicibacterium chubuense NBB4]